MNEERFHLLVERYLEGRLLDAEARELVEAVERDEALRRRMLDEVSMAGLLSRGEGQGSIDLAPRVQAALRPHSEKNELVGKVLDRLPGRRADRRWLVPLAAAAALVIGVVLWLTLRPSPGGVTAETPKLRREPVPVTDPAIEAAAARAVAYLRKSPIPDGPWNGPVPAEELVLLALHHAGVLADDPQFRPILEKALARPLLRTYSVSLQAVLLERLDAPKYRDRLAECARFLVENQCASGQWAYSKPAPLLDKKSRSGPGAGNNSCSLFAAMGLRACAAAGIVIPRETIVRARDGWRSSQRPDQDRQFGRGRAGWCYSREEEDHRPYGSMTAGGLAALITLDHLAGDDWRKDAAAQAARNWLTYHFTPSENYGPVEELMAKEMVSDTPNPLTEYYYYLWALERAGALLGTPKLGDRDWYAEGAQEILATQRPDGSWYSGVRRCNPVWDTCYAILFLKRSTRPLEK